MAWQDKSLTQPWGTLYTHFQRTVYFLNFKIHSCLKNNCPFNGLFQATKFLDQKVSWQVLQDRSQSLRLQCPNSCDLIIRIKEKYHSCSVMHYITQ